ncbi:hypothetical protein GLW04_19320 [Halobacillus litoralis]|uniref:Uncharacterized protein n=1 Tax=Halobacillus litoralis TaxID=45668 RepID=A0A845DYA6_9BACI|nr:hypothetical protein [Halobacillus litoralis]MYL22028.1 hypothetical protein [Halobacillus litoralis]
MANLLSILGLLVTLVTLLFGSEIKHATDSLSYKQKKALVTALISGSGILLIMNFTKPLTVFIASNPLIILGGLLIFLVMVMTVSIVKTLA